MAQATTKPTRRRKTKRSISVGQVHVHATFNNTIVTISDESGNAVAWASAGGSGFKGSRKSTPYAAGIAAEKAIAAAKEMGLSKVNVFVRGVGSGRESAVRALGAAGIQVASIKDTTPIAHNGTRPRKPRRV